MTIGVCNMGTPKTMVIPNKDSTPDIKQLRTTIGIAGLPDSDIFNPDVISLADIVWTKQELPEANLISINGEFRVKENQDVSYKNIFWMTPEGYELFDGTVVIGQFVEIMHWTPLESQSLNALANVSGVIGWSNFGNIDANVYTINVTLRGI